VEAHERAEDARRKLGLSVDALWIAYVGLGGAGELAQLTRYLDDGSGLDETEHDYVAQALNDRFVDAGLDHPVPYSEESSDA
jgi:hypothetical protein